MALGSVVVNLSECDFVTDIFVAFLTAISYSTDIQWAFTGKDLFGLLPCFSCHFVISLAHSLP